MYSENFGALEATLGYSFKDRTILERALTHRSALIAVDRADYERLEFLGDAVLDLAIAHLLTITYTRAREGILSKMRAALVNAQSLAIIARDLQLSPYIRLGKNELANGAQERASIMADVLEAVIGAIYRDSDFPSALRVVEKIFGKQIALVQPYDPKTELQEALHAASGAPPIYNLELIEGPEHAPVFVMSVSINGEVTGRGKGSTKKAAEQAAAAEALPKILAMHPELCIKTDVAASDTEEIR